MTRLWQVVLILPTNTTNCERGFSTQNHINSLGKCAMNISNLELLMRIALAKIPMECIYFEDIWDTWMCMKNKRSPKLGSDSNLQHESCILVQT
jgi:hypothetical protein